MSGGLPASARKVQAALSGLGLDCRVLMMPGSTRTAQEAADQVGCELAQIAKSLVLKKPGGEVLLVIASGPNRVDFRKVAALAGCKVKMADPELVRQVTGFAIGGVPPMGHAAPLQTFIDQDLMALDEIWAAAGTPQALFAITPGDLARASGGRVADVCRD